MNVKIVEGVRHSKGLKDCVVVIDTFRASNTILAILERGGSEIYIPSSSKQADKLSKGCTNFLYFGESRGNKLPEADYDNSPSHAYRLNLEGKTIILYTSRGSKAISAPKDAKEILVACFGNAEAISKYLSRTPSENIALVACGEEHGQRASEDYMCAQYIRSLIEGTPLDFNIIREEISRNSGANRLRRNGQLDDLNFCLQLNYSAVIPKAERREGLVVVKKLT